MVISEVESYSQELAKQLLIHIEGLKVLHSLINDAENARIYDPQFQSLLLRLKEKVPSTGEDEMALMELVNGFMKLADDYRFDPPRPVFYG